MLSQVLGVLIAFVTVILLLSMVVTGLVQATQAVLRLRSRNLQQGVAALLEKYSGGGRSGSEYRGHAAQVLNAPNLAVLEKVDQGGSKLRRFLGPKVSWAEPAELAAAVAAVAGHLAHTPGGVPRAAAAPAEGTAVAGTPGVGAPVAIEQDVKRMEPALSKRFQLIIRLWTIFWSFVVAVLFQVSTPELLSSFTGGTRSTQPYVGATDKVLALGTEAGLAVGIDDDAYENAANQALSSLARKFPQDADQIAQAGVGGTTKADLKDELSDVLHDVSDRDTVLREYEVLLDDLTATRATSGARTSEAAEAQLEAFGIRFWGQGASYYRDPLQGLRWAAIIGVLMTGILMSFGAPFWFKQLQFLASLRDQRAPKAKAGK